MKKVDFKTRSVDLTFEMWRLSSIPNRSGYTLSAPLHLQILCSLLIHYKLCSQIEVPSEHSNVSVSSLLKGNNLGVSGSRT